jgi:hypothetical protein
MECAFFLVDLIVSLSGPKSKSEQNQLSSLEGENEAETTSQIYVNFIHFVQLSALLRQQCGLKVRTATTTRAIVQEISVILLHNAHCRAVLPRNELR